MNWLCRVMWSVLSITVLAAVCHADPRKDLETIRQRTFDARDPVVADISVHCLAAITVQVKGVDARADIVRLSEALIAAVRKDPATGQVGWGRQADIIDSHCSPPGWDVWRSGLCNPLGTNYMFQTGYATTCLARAALALREPRYAQFAAKVFDESFAIGTRLADCPECFYYWYSYNPNDQGIFVRNTNALMGMAAAWLWKAGGDDRYRDRAKQIAASERREVRAGNQGFFGIDDRRHASQPERERNRIENHAVIEAKSVADIGLITEDESTTKTAVDVMLSWLNCPHCQRMSCKNWATDYSKCPGNIAPGPCFLENQDPYLHLKCAQVRAEIARPSAHQIWILNDAMVSEIQARP